MSRLGRSQAKVEVLDLVRLMGQGRQLELDERKATSVAVYEPMSVPPALRTPEYSAALGVEHRDVEVLRDRLCVFYLHEAALHARVGDDEVMAGQLRALVDSPWPVRLVTFAVGGGACLLRPFEYLEFVDEPPVAYVGEHPDVAGGHREALAELDRLALSELASRLFLLERAGVFAAS
ncbi:hypothetical protein GCM10022243_58680 [Saccharothrix violaceirubra]